MMKKLVVLLAVGIVAGVAQAKDRTKDTYDFKISTISYQSSYENVDLMIDIKGEQRGDKYCLELGSSAFTVCSSVEHGAPVCSRVKSLCVKTKGWKK